MAFLFPSGGPEPRAHRVEDDYLSAFTGKGIAQKTSRTNTSDTPNTATDAQPTCDGAADTVPPTFQTPPVAQPRKRIVFADPFAFRYLEDDPTVNVVERRGVLRGYEAYLVEQWACSRKSPTLVIATYTGDQKHSVVVAVLSVPEDESMWPAKLRTYFRAIRDLYARPKETVLGELMVTNLSSFPSALTVIPIPKGDIRKYRNSFIINENLKRLGCSGRSGMTLSDPTEATQAKFQQLFKTSDRVPVSTAVIELIKLCQAALYIFDKLGHEFIDGLLCDKTETAVNNWWIELGAEHYNFEPTDGILGPTTVSALLGMFMGARNRLHWYGAPVSKDVFDIECTKRGVSHFQKSQKLARTRRLDRPTLVKLYTASAKAAAGEGWGVQRAVKSTVTEIGGKRGELVMGMVSGKDKGLLADIETLDFDRFVSLAYGERPKWLWHGKPRRTPGELPENSSDLANGLAWEEDENNANPQRAFSTPADADIESKRFDESPGFYSAYPTSSATSIGEGPADRDALRKNVFKSVAGKMSDARSGFGRIKDAVGGGLRGHNTRPSVSAREDFADMTPGGLSQTHDAAILGAVSTLGVPRAFTWKNKPEEYLAAMKRGDPDALPGPPGMSHFASTSTLDFKSVSAPARTEQDGQLTEIGAEVRQAVLSKVPSAVGSLVDENDLLGPLLEAELNAKHSTGLLVRRHSIHVAGCRRKKSLNENRWPRRMSFGDAEEAVLRWDEIIDLADATGDPASLEAFKNLAQLINQHIDEIKTGLEPWVVEKLKAVQILDGRFSREKDELHALYYALSEACQRMRLSSDELLADERSHLSEELKEIEALIARLDYEINALLQKVFDVEDGIGTFERQVEDLEKRAEALKVQLEAESWSHWLFRTITGIGTGNITLGA